jgi:hypothetical protein
MAAHGRTTETNGQTLPIASAMPAQMIVSDKVHRIARPGVRARHDKMRRLPGRIEDRAPSTKHPAGAPERMKISEDKPRPSPNGRPPSSAKPAARNEPHSWGIPALLRP